MMIGIVVGICVEHDAISAAASDQAEMLGKMDWVRSVDVFTTHHARRVQASVHVVASPWDLARHRVLQECDVVIFHWGIYSPLFDAVWALPRHQRVIVHFHNVTPRQLASEGAAEVAEKSFLQLEALAAIDAEVWTYSEFNRLTLLEFGVDPSRIDDVPFPIEPPRGLHSHRDPGRVDLLCVGRFTPAKAPHVAIEALRVLEDRSPGRYRLTLAGNPALSDPSYHRELKRLVTRLALKRSVRLCNPDDDELWRLYESAHVVVSPSLHEGLCVPIIEGYLAGCHAIGTTAGNLPYVVRPPDPVVEPNDPVALAGAIESVEPMLGSPSEAWLAGVSALCERFSRQQVRETTMSALGGSATADGGA